MSKAKTPEQKAADKAKKDAAKATVSAKSDLGSIGKDGSVDVVGGNGEVIRTYSKQQHGADFLELAKEFASKVAGRTLQ